MPLSIDHLRQFLPLSFSSLKAFHASPRHFLHYKARTLAQTAAMAYGTAVHRRILEPDIFAEHYVLYEGRRDKRTKEYKEFLENHPDQEVLSSSEAEQIEETAESVYGHPEARRLMEGLSCSELPIEFQDHQYGLEHRGFIDGVSSNYLLDLKTTSRVDGRSVERLVWEQLYYLQAALYAYGYGGGKDEGIMNFDFFLVVVQSAPPYEVAVYQIPRDYLWRGWDLWYELLDKFVLWDGQTRHRYNGVETLAPPVWAMVDEITDGDRPV